VAEALTERLLYVADPMCSWCWGFAPVLSELEPRLRPGVELHLVMGGLAPDDDRPMDPATARYVQNAWRAVEARTGARFEHAFWERCTPRRSTWPACRAVLAAGDRGTEMYGALQRAYYLEARDPSDRATLIAVAGELGFDESAFAERIDADETWAALSRDFELRDRSGVTGYPSLVLQRGDEFVPLTRGWVDEPEAARVVAGAGLL
jgi:putative protein-disulfide isomerase